METKQDFRRQAEELVDQMTVEEMISQLCHDAPPIPRLGIPGYNWWNEALHGVANAGTATVFPQAIALAAMFDEELLGRIGETIATEARAKYNAQSAEGDTDIFKGLTFCSPNINIFRDPRWGRGHETYGEDPYLTSRLGVAFIRGLQGDGKYLKASACAKHFAVHSGPEKERHTFDAQATAKDMEETYLPAFRAAVQEGGVEEVMGAYNRTNGEPCCASETLLQKTLREKWGFTGHVVSDAGALRDIHEHHGVTATAAESAALALRNGCDLNIGSTYRSLPEALEEGLVSEEEIRRAAVRLFTTRMKLGLFDPECEFNRIPYEENDSPAHRLLSLEAARRSVVLLKNDGLLPLERSKLRTVGVIGPTADLRTVLAGNYHGTASEYVTNLEGIREAAGDRGAGQDGIRVLYSEGCHLWKDRMDSHARPGDRISEAVTVARHSDVVILCVGLDASLEGEGEGRDKTDLLLPESQRRLMEAVCAVGTPVVLVLNAGSAIDLSGIEEHCSAILDCWYSGAQGGRALAEILFGEVNPSGKLPVTFYHDGTLPDFRDYRMKGRTYRYLEGEPLYPFGYGLSYSRFRFDDLRLETAREAAGAEKMSETGTSPETEAAVVSAPETPLLRGSIRVTNLSSRDGAAVIQVYVDSQPLEKASNGKNQAYMDRFDSANQPHHSLRWFARVQIAAGQTVPVPFELPREAFETVLEDGSRVLLAGRYTVCAGGSQPDARSRELLGGEDWLSGEVEVE